MSTDHPTFANGKICYIELPVNDINVSSDFYHKVFGWRVRKRSDGSVAFDDGVGEVSGTSNCSTPGKDYPEINALFSDPAGNILGIYQQRS